MRACVIKRVRPILYGPPCNQRQNTKLPPCDDTNTDELGIPGLTCEQTESKPELKPTIDFRQNTVLPPCDDIGNTGSFLIPRRVPRIRLPGSTYQQMMKIPKHHTLVANKKSTL